MTSKSKYYQPKSLKKCAYLCMKEAIKKSITKKEESTHNAVKTKSQQKKIYTRPPRTMLQCDFCGKINVNVKHHGDQSFASATNFCRPNDRSKASRCYKNYAEYISRQRFSKNLPYIVQKEYVTHQLQPKKNRLIDDACHYCGTDISKNATATQLVQTYAYRLSSYAVDVYKTMLDQLGHQVFCKNKDCFEQFVEFIQHPPPCKYPHIFKRHSKYVLRDNSSQNL